jgi:hypothetical protein
MDALTSIMPVLTGGAQVASAGSNIYEGYKQQQYQDKLRALAQNPAQMNQYAQGFVQPLNAGLEKGVANEAQAYAAERGLGQSPGPSSEILAQAIAPYVQQNSQAGYQNALQALNLGGGARPPNTQQGLTQLFAGLKPFTQLGQPGSGGGGNPAAAYQGLDTAQGIAMEAPPPQPTPTPSLDFIPTQGLQDFAFPAGYGG